MRFVSRVDMGLGHADSTRFECKSCGASYELDRQMCTECGGHCIGYCESWLQEELRSRTSSDRFD